MNSKRIRDELIALQARAPKRVLKVDDVYKWAERNTTSALHAALEWDDAKAAREHRLNQIRSFIRIYVVDESGEPEFVALSIDRPTGGGYRKVTDVLNNATLSSVMLNDALDELDRMKVKYARVKELTSVWSAAELLRAKTRLKEKATKRSAA